MLPVLLRSALRVRAATALRNGHLRRKTEPIARGFTIDLFERVTFEISLDEIVLVRRVPELELVRKEHGRRECEMRKRGHVGETHRFARGQLGDASTPCEKNTSEHSILLFRFMKSLKHVSHLGASAGNEHAQQSNWSIDGQL